MADQHSQSAGGLGQTLSNHAAEFVELRGGREICRRATGTVVAEPNITFDSETETPNNSEGIQEPVAKIEAPRFVSSFDGFVPQTEVPK